MLLSLQASVMSRWPEDPPKIDIRVRSARAGFHMLPQADQVTGATCCHVAITFVVRRNAAMRRGRHVFAVLGLHVERDRRLPARRRRLSASQPESRLGDAQRCILSGIGRVPRYSLA